MITLIKIENITKSYSKNENEKILKGISINFGEKGFVTILGKSGSGKTTLLNIIGGLDKGKGTIYYDEKKINKYNSKIIDLYRSKHIGYVFQNYLLMQDLTVYENIDIALSLSGINNKDERKKRIDKCLKAVGMERYKRRVSSALSGGQQQRVAIARALSKNTDVLICDEPTGNLDSINSKAIMNILKGISKHRLVILVTHNEDLAYQYSDRIIRLVDGKVESDKENVSSINVDQNYVIDKSKLQKEQISKDKLNVEVYADQNAKDIKLSIISYDNKLKIVVESGQTMLDERYQIVGKIMEQQEDSDIDISFDENFDNRKEKTKFWDKIAKSFSRVTNIKKGKRALYLGFFVFGVLISTMLYLFQSAFNFNQKMNPRSYFDDQVILLEDRNSSSTSYYFEKQDIMNWLKDSNSGIDSVEPIYVYYPQLSNAFVYEKIPSGRPGNPYISTSSRVYIIYQSQYEKYYKNLKCGRLPQKENEVIVTSKIIDSLAMKYLANYDLIDYEDFIDCYFDFGPNYEKYYISGIVDSNLTFIGCSNSNYIEFVNASLDNLVGSYYINAYKKMFSSTLKIIKDDYIKDHEFNILDIENSYLNCPTHPRKSNVYMTKKFYYDYYSCYGVQNLNYRGVIDGEESALIFETEQDYNLFLDLFYLSDKFKDSTSGSLYFRSLDLLDDSKIHYIGDERISNFDDIIVSKTLYDKNKIFTFGNVVGYFDDNGYNVGDVYASNKFAEAFIKIPDKVSIFNEDLSFIINDLKSATNYFDEYGLIVLDREGYEDANSDNAIYPIFFVTIGIILALSGLFIYLMNRSKMIKNIYTIGVFRSIGVKKSVIYRVFILDSILITTLTMAFGFTFVSLIILYLSKIFLIECLSWWLFLLGIIGIYGVNLFSSLLPLILLLRKTPREITIKYDI